jgi:hypothetical protein
MTDAQQPIPEESLEGIEYVGMTDEPKPDPKPEDDDTLELTEEDEVAPPDEGEPEEAKKRHKSAKERIGELTAKARSAERELETERAQRAELERRIAALESGHKPDVQQPAALQPPNPNDYEFGEDDPKYDRDLIRYELKKEIADERAAAAEKETEAAKKARAKEVGDKLDADWQTMQARGAEKYEDFGEKVADLKVSEPILALAIQASPVGDEAAYYLASNPHEAELIQAQIAAGDVIGAAKAFGEIEGASLVEAPVRPTNGNPLDLALYAGRLKAFKSKEAKPKGKLATDAPEPPSQRVRGASGQFEPDWSDENADLSKLGKLLG